jgi:photosystem II stability/assembly factor-like uncharacterized protein
MNPVCCSLLCCLVSALLAGQAIAGDPAGQRKPAWEDPAARASWFWQQRALPGTRVPEETYRRAVLRAASMETALQSRDGGDRPTWDSLGPAPLPGVSMFGDGTLTASGRALSVEVHPTDARVLLLGTAQGGIWRSNNGGQHFVSVADNLPSLAIKVIRFAPSNPAIVYAGSGEPHSKTSIFGMGVFKSEDAGLTWSALPDHGPGWDFRFLAISGLRVHPENPNLLFVTTADVLPDRVNVNQAPPARPPTGIFRSTDGGRTWKLTQPATDFRAFMYPVHDPYLASGVGFMDLELYAANPSVVFASEYSGGIWRSVDAGDTWQRVTPVKNRDGGAAMGADFPAPVPTFSYFDCAASEFHTYPVLGRSPSTPEFNRIEITLAQAGRHLTTDWGTTVVYASVGTVLRLDVNGNGAFDEGVDVIAPQGLLFKSADGGQSWMWLGDWLDGIPAYCDTCGGPTMMNCAYDNTVEVNPADADDVVVGGNANYSSYWPDPLGAPARMLAIPWTGVVYRSVDGGATWVDTTPACTRYELDSSKPPVQGLPVWTCREQPGDKIVHVDVHGATFVPGKPSFFVVTDGGLYEGSILGSGTNPLTDYSWRPLNEGLSTLQFFQAGSHPTNPDKLVGGMQDNATGFWNGSEWKAWDWHQSDGTIGLFDPRNPEHVYIGWQFSLARHDHGGNNVASEWKTLFSGAIGDDTSFPFVTVVAIDPVATNIIFTASTSAVYRSTDRGDTWSAPLNREPFDGEPTALAVSPRNHSLLWVGTSTGRVYLFDTRRGTMRQRTGADFPNRWISRIEAPANLGTGAIVVFSGYDASSANTFAGGNGHTGKVFATSDGGGHWHNLSGNLTGANDLDVPVSTIAMDTRHSGHMWIGTDAGILETRSGGRSWTPYRGNMPVVVTMSLDYNMKTGYLTAATFGRGIWRTRPGQHGWQW